MKTVIGIPGQWESSGELSAQLLEQSSLLFLGPNSLLMDVETQEVLAHLELHEKNDKLRRAFEVASGHGFAPRLYADIEAHTMTAYLIDEQGGSLASAERMSRLAEAFLDAGGLAVKVESAGVAHTPEAWREYRADEQWIKAFVVALSSPERVESCGMHLLGLPDAQVWGSDDLEARRTLDAFLGYLLWEKPRLKEGQTFSAAIDAPRYVLRQIADRRYPPDSLFHNPFGFWELRPV